MNDYISCADTAKYVRAALKRAFPGVKFSVRSKTYSGGASIRISWTDGPTRKEVKDVVGVYAGGSFDGMIDLAYNVQTWLLPDGSASLGHSYGTEGSLGVHPGYHFDSPCLGARLVHFGADSIFYGREYSEGFARVVRDKLASLWSRVPGDFPEVREGSGGWFLDWDHPNYWSGPGGCDPCREFWTEAEA